MAKTITVERRSLTAQVTDALRELIMMGQYGQGVPLRQGEVAERLGVSRVPVREAFQQLEAEGLITNVPYKGAIVTCLTPEEIREYFDIRATLEADLLKQAIEKMRPENIERARKALERSKNAAPAKWGEYNWQLHSELYAAAGCPITLELVKKIHDNLDRYVRIQMSLSQHNRERAHKEHERLIQLYEEKRTKQAVALLLAHIAQARDDLLDKMESHDAAEKA